MSKILKIQENIRELQKHLSSSLDYKEISNKILNIAKEFRLPIKFINYPQKTIFYRARTINSIEDLNDWKKSDYWEVPSNLVKSYGRLNFPGESVFYLSTNALQTLKEIRYKYNKIVVISAYEAIDNFPSVKIGEAMPEDMLGTKYWKNEEEFIVANMIADFFNSIFSYPVGKGTEGLYKFSNAVAKNLYDLPFETSKAWTYSAIQNKESLNIAFKQNVAKKFLKYKGSVCLIPVAKNGFKIPFCINDKYQEMVNYNNMYKEWILNNFKFSYSNDNK